MTEDSRTREAVFDPLSDLMVALASLILVLAALLAPLASEQGPAGERPAFARPTEHWTIEGLAAAPYVALPTGLQTPAGEFLPLDAILTDASISEAMDLMRPLFLVVEPGGDEAAFTLEALAAARGINDVAILRRGRGPLR